MTMESTTPELWAPRRRSTTIGILLLISLIAFESMGVGTAMPAVPTSAVSSSTRGRS